MWAAARPVFYAAGNPFIARQTCRRLPGSDAAKAAGAVRVVEAALQP